MIARVAWTRGTITGNLYPVLKVTTGRTSLGHDEITLSLSCAAYEEDRIKALAELQSMADRINYEGLSRH
jgi:hypothetical protein